MIDNEDIRLVRGVYPACICVYENSLPHGSEWWKLYADATKEKAIGYSFMNEEKAWNRLAERYRREMLKKLEW